MFPNVNRSTVIAVALCGFITLVASGCGSREERAQGYYQQAQAYLEKNDYVKARLELRNALQLKGDMVEAWRALAQIEEHDRNWQALSGSLRKVVELDPKDSQARAKLGKLLLLGGALDDALKLANAASELDPKDASFLALKAAILFKLKDPDGALQNAQAALAIDPGNAEASSVLALAKYSRGDTPGALQVLDNIAAGHKDDVGILALKINILDRSGNVQEAERLLRRLVELNPKEPAFRTQLIGFYISHKRNDDALKELRAAVKANPDDTTAEFQLVSLLNAVQGPAAARAELAARADAGGKVFPYQIALAKLDFLQGKEADATQLLSKLIGGTASPEDSLTAKVTLAEMYVTKRNFAAAEPLISEILRADNRNIDGLRLRATMRVDRAQFDDAIADLRSALNDQPQSPILLGSLAVAYERSGSIELADKAYFDAAKASGFAPAYGLSYVAFLRRRGLNEHAESVLNDLVSRNPKSTAVLSSFAQSKLAQQDWGAAHTIADSIRRLGDQEELADQISGAAFSGQKKYDQSLAAFQSAYEANPAAPQPMAALVATYLQTKQIDKADSFVQAALKANPHNVEAIVLKGSVQLAKNDPVQAEKDFKRAIEEQPQNIVGYSALANLYIQQRKRDEALGVVQSGLQRSPKNLALRLNLASLLEAKGDFEGAIAEYDDMLKDQPGSMIVANNLASLLADHRADKASLDRAGTLAAFLRNSQVPQFKDTLGWVAFQRGDYTSARPLLEAAATDLPNVALVQFHLGMVYKATGQEANASKQFEKARSLAPNDNELRKKIDAALSEKTR